jgi:hypothetical protein
MTKYDISRPGKLLTKIKKQYCSAETEERRQDIARRHAIVEVRVRQLLDLYSLAPFSEKIN